jgi:hypothetical protein
MVFVPWVNVGVVKIKSHRYSGAGQGFQNPSGAWRTAAVQQQRSGPAWQFEGRAILGRGLFQTNLSGCDAAWSSRHPAVSSRHAWFYPEYTDCSCSIQVVGILSMSDILHQYILKGPSRTSFAVIFGCTGNSQGEQFVKRKT